MFEAHKRKAAHEQYEHDVAAWNDQLSGLRELLALAQGASVVQDGALMLSNGENCIAQITNVSLIEVRSTGGHWQGGSQGVSFPVGSIGGRNIRYHVGMSRGHYVQGEPHPTAIDSGTLTITTRRIVFQGAAKSIECLFSKLLGVTHRSGEIMVAVSNRQKPMNVFFGVALDEWVTNHLNVALALFRGSSSATTSQLQQQITELESQRPTEPKY